MKTVNRFSLLLIVLILSVAPSKIISAQNYDVDYQVFYDDLSPYGTWVQDQNYGYVWIPDVDPGFQPYATNGHWVYTVYGWTWISDYPWGWAPFHYGRWSFDPVYGSMWIPGNEWGPAWVSWRHSNGYYGWAPLGPGVNINIAITNYSVPAERWVFVRDRYLYSPDLHRYWVNPRENVTIINNSTVINNTYIDNSRNITYISGPNRREIQRETGRNIRTVQVRDANAPSQRMVGKDQVQLYRPRVENRSGDNKRIAPSKVANYQDVKPVNQRGRTELRQERAGTQQTGNQRTDVKRQPADTRSQQQQQVRNQDQQLRERNSRQQEQQVQPAQRQQIQSEQRQQNVKEQQNQVRQQPQQNQSRREIRQQQRQPERQQPTVRQQNSQQPASRKEMRLQNRQERQNSRQPNRK